MLDVICDSDSVVLNFGALKWNRKIATANESFDGFCSMNLFIVAISGDFRSSWDFSEIVLKFICSMWKGEMICRKVIVEFHTKTFTKMNHNSTCFSLSLLLLLLRNFSVSSFAKFESFERNVWDFLRNAFARRFKFVPTDEINHQNSSEREIEQHVKILNTWAGWDELILIFSLSILTVRSSHATNDDSKSSKQLRNKSREMAHHNEEMIDKVLVCGRAILAIITSEKFPQKP